MSPKNTLNTQIRKYRSASEFESRKKRFSSDPGLVGNLANQKNVIPEACNMKNGKSCIRYICVSLNNFIQNVDKITM